MPSEFQLTHALARGARVPYTTSRLLFYALMALHWIEPIKTAKVRARFWNQPRITVPLMLWGTVCFALIFSIPGSIAVRLFTGNWHGFDPARLFAMFGGILGLLMAFSQRVRMKRQEVELLTDRCTVLGIRPRSLSYDRLRGYSIVNIPHGSEVQRLLMLYPRIGRAFSIGIIPEVTDEQICEAFGDRVPFVTIIDDQALANPYAAVSAGSKS